MFVDVDEYVEVMSDLGISANQFLLCYLLHADQRVDGKLVPKGANMSNFYKYTSKACKWTQSEVDDLIAKGYVIDRGRPSDKTHPDYLIVTDEFVNKVFITRNKFKEFWDAYPFIVPNFNNPRGPAIKLKTGDMEELADLYTRKVKTQALHNKILELLEWGIENNHVNMSMERFIKSQLWETLEYLRNNEDTSDNFHVV